MPTSKTVLISIRTHSPELPEIRTGPDACSGYTTKIRLYAPNGTLIQQAAEGVFSDISLTLPATGTYVLVASDSAGSIPGLYTLLVFSSSTTVTATPLSFGTSVASTLASTGELDQYTVSASPVIP